MDRASRSPRYPSIGLKEAIYRLETIYSSIKTGEVDRNTLAQAMGYNTRNGASDAVAAALSQYQLIDAYKRSRVKISSLGLAIISGDGNRLDAIQKAAFSPSLFARLNAEYSDRSIPVQDLTNDLIEQGFNKYAAAKAARAYSETVSFVARERGLADDERVRRDQEDATPSPERITGVVTWSIPLKRAGQTASVTLPKGIDPVEGIDVLIDVLKLYKELLLRDTASEHSAKE